MPGDAPDRHRSNDHIGGRVQAFPPMSATPDIGTGHLRDGAARPRTQDRPRGGPSFAMDEPQRTTGRASRDNHLGGFRADGMRANGRPIRQTETLNDKIDRTGLHGRHAARGP